MPRTIWRQAGGEVKRGGYDSYRSDEALQQAKARGENIGWDRAFGIAGSVAESIWLAILICAVCYFYGQALFNSGTLLPAMLIVGVAAVAAPRSAGWLVKPFGDSLFRRLLWGLSAAATLLLVVRVALAAVLVIQLRLQGVGEEAAGIGAFHGAARFTLMIAMPVWFLYAFWGWLRRRSLPCDSDSPLWRRVLPIVFVFAMMVFLGHEGAYFDSRPAKL
ncbi:hypothetical protein [Reyranella sp.]|uniref:hypothetical protein n=1 Tax=Reyranella sp. TaxID=1929291 RepID=UPI00403575A1